MTVQYQQNNINLPRGSRTLTADTALNLDDDLVVVEGNTAPVTLTLPRAAQIPAQTIVIKAPNAAAFNVTIAAQAGENIDGAATFVMDTDEQALVVKSDGTNWRDVCCVIGDGDGDGDGDVDPTARDEDFVLNAPGTITLFGFNIDADTTVEVINLTNGSLATVNSVTPTINALPDYSTLEVDIEFISLALGALYGIVIRQTGTTAANFAGTVTRPPV